MRTYLFGAGASHSYAQSPTGVCPPLAKNFFRTYRHLDIAADRMVRVGSVINYVRDTRGLNPIEFAEWQENIEDFLTEIDELIGTKEVASKLDFREKFQYDQAYTQMLFLFSAVLNEIQNGPACENYARLCAQLGNNDKLITFNWDTLLDRALNSTGDWRPDDGYGVAFREVFRDGWESPSVVEASKYPLIKLHGSTNWLMPYLALDYPTGERRFSNRSIKPHERPVYCFHYASKKYPTYSDRSRTEYEPFSYFYYPPDIPVGDDNEAQSGYKRISVVAAPDVPEHGEVRVGGSPFVSMPLLIPPVRNKQFSLMGDTFDNLWRIAEAAMIECDELVIIGYSFPVSDIRAWALLENALASRKNKLSIKVVDPYPKQLVQRLSNKLSDKIIVSVFEDTFKAFIESITEKV